MKIMNATKRVMGEKIFNKIMKMTVYGQFVAGEDKEAIKVMTEISVQIWELSILLISP